MPDLSALQRQRRFIILMSLTVIGFYALGARVNDTAESSGFSVTLQDPEFVVWLLWIVWGWALVRYVQRIYELAHEVWKEVVEDVGAEDLRIAARRATRYARQLANSNQFDERGKTNVSVVGSVKILVANDQVNSTATLTMPGFTPTRDGGRKYAHLAVMLSWGTAPEVGGGSQAFQMEMSRGAVRWLRARAWLYAVTALPAFSEHIAPLLLAAATPFVVLISPQRAPDVPCIFI